MHTITFIYFYIDNVPFEDQLEKLETVKNKLNGVILKNLKIHYLDLDDQPIELITQNEFQFFGQDSDAVVVAKLKKHQMLGQILITAQASDGNYTKVRFDIYNP